MDNQNTYTVMLAKIRAHRATKDVINEALKDFNLTVSEWLILGAVKKAGRSASTSKLASELSVSMPLISRTTKALEKMQLISVVISKDDKRGRSIKLTCSGELLLLNSEPVVRKSLAKWLKPIDRASVDIYINVLLQVAYKL